MLSPSELRAKAFQQIPDGMPLPHDTAERRLRDLILDGAAASGGVMFSQTADVTTANTNQALSAFGAGVGSLILPAGFWTPGKWINIAGAGVFSTMAIPGTFTARLFLGSSLLATAVIGNLLSNANNSQFGFSMDILCKSVSGDNAVLSMNGRLTYDISATDDNKASMNNAGAAVTVANNVAQTLDVTTQWGMAAAGNTITTKQALVRVFG